MPLPEGPQPIEILNLMECVIGDMIIIDTEDDGSLTLQVEQIGRPCTLICQKCALPQLNGTRITLRSSQIKKGDSLILKNAHTGVDLRYLSAIRSIRRTPRVIPPPPKLPSPPVLREGVPISDEVADTSHTAMLRVRGIQVRTVIPTNRGKGGNQPK